MINNISNVDTQVQPKSVIKTVPSMGGIPMAPVLGFKTPLIKEKAILRVKKFKRADNIAIVGEIDDDYVDIVEDNTSPPSTNMNFFKFLPEKKKLKYLKNSYVIDYIQSPRSLCGLGTEAIKGLAEKAMFDTRAEGRIVTFCAPVWKESSPAQFFRNVAPEIVVFTSRVRFAGSSTLSGLKLRLHLISITLLTRCP